MPKPVIELEKIDKAYRLGKERFLPVLKNINFALNKGDFIAIMGPSGSGKSTLMNIIGLLDRPNSGLYRLDSQDTETLPKRQFSKLRGKKVGFIFQNYNLLPRYSVYKNVELPLIYAKVERAKRKELVSNAIKSVGLSNRIKHKPNELSGGEAQRAAIARAIVNAPEIILADEPTGNLDSKTGLEIMSLLKNANKKGATVVVVTHDPKIAQWADKTITMVDGEFATGKDEKK
ncbi:MAG: macrolide ABC transporter ATP-binding protein [Candidatus Kerfeldbacteria bacterium CG_4_10_14_0_8_um_filter_42_10]|uniref:Macrolide ABC transporter ATP-binding protein n=1 Tax=Candidatus Kerfeldbacteria bacterium CG_4_10_14_0_8_um_filter_42_10 TaxID=2014248 RepID=A0A2M7RLE3_9BACT|nr:MAG: macrolide ABC transporter ATP-binding protein [Candidatus Kerfeldbacteria bacterium CG_4_10_14_0_8_um_filter_42_10]